MLSDSQSKTIHKIQQEFEDNKWCGMGVTQIKKWFNQFQKGCTLVKIEHHSRRPQTAQNAAVVARIESGNGRSPFDHKRDW